MAVCDVPQAKASGASDAASRPVRPSLRGCHGVQVAFLRRVAERVALEPDEFVDVGVHVDCTLAVDPHQEHNRGHNDDELIDVVDLDHIINVEGSAGVGDDEEEDKPKWLNEYYGSVGEENPELGSLLSDEDRRREQRRLTNVQSKRNRLAKETDGERQARRQREAEAKRRRRQNETPEQRQRRLALHAERMRKARRMSKATDFDLHHQQQAQPQQQPSTSHRVGQPLRTYSNTSYGYIQETETDNSSHLYQSPDRLQVVMPHLPQYHQVQPAQQYRNNGPNAPTVITVPIPPQQVGNGPVTIHVTLPEHMNLQHGQVLTQIPSNMAYINAGGQGAPLVLTSPPEFGSNQPVHVIRIQAQPQQGGGHVPATVNSGHQPSQHIIIQQPHQQPQQQITNAQSRPLPHTSSISSDRPVPHRFKNLSDEQIARRRRANAERSRRRRAMETADQRAERNRRTAERMRQRRAKIAEERVRPNERTVNTLTAARFEEIYLSVLDRNKREVVKEEADQGKPFNNTSSAVLTSTGGPDLYGTANEGSTYTYNDSN